MTPEWPPSDLFDGDVTWNEIEPGMWVSEVRRADEHAIEARHMWWVHNRPDGHHCGLARIAFGPGHHTLEAEGPLTISPSLLCSCGLHGWIREGHWVSA